ncbi:D-alanyl-D-alanine carboxypeptidase family protein [Candidatus Dojkabacteria bacterium]|uniref:D-alanyl-D-alanine carboxypeptidase family protein n=1 Tax=Candidatus Dojkabacteria bacterium TaxID=2099670 RepID=A0A3M0Z1U6_9BACT|nr:MAG: D-alanyl-D-alanine carboxypeptidase family protein [Candidatus Dojkabacteria bacterium]
MRKKVILIATASFVSLILVAYGSDVLKDQSVVDLSKNFQKETPIEIKNGFEISEDDSSKIALNGKVLSNQIVTAQSEFTARFTTNKEVELFDTNDAEILQFSKNENEYRYIVKISNLGPGENLRTIKLRTKINSTYNIQKNKEEFPISNRIELSWEIYREKEDLGFSQGYIPRFEGSGYIFDGDDLAANVSKRNSLTSDYAPKDLVDLNLDKKLITNTPKMFLRAEAADALVEMLKQLKKETGKDLVIASGYRSFRNQESTYTGWVKQFGKIEADRISARPGYSEHQLGTAVDFFSSDTGFQFTNEFDKSVVGKWLKENSYKFGFIQSYPEGKENITGYKHEAWHYRFVGYDTAKKVRESGLTLVEFLSNI